MRGSREALKELCNDIVEYYVQLNWMHFTREEIEEGAEDVLSMLKNDKVSLLDMLKEEHDNSCNRDVLVLRERILAII